LQELQFEISDLSFLNEIKNAPMPIGADYTSDDDGKSSPSANAEVTRKIAPNAINEAKNAIANDTGSAGTTHNQLGWGRDRF
jgi:hypothetical protein